MADLKHKITIKDDGTLDTVVCCEECGEECRYNFEGNEAGGSYQDFVKWAIADFDSEHECQI